MATVEWEKEGREIIEKEKKKPGRVASFFANFQPDFFDAQAMKFIPIYRGWKRKVLSLMVPNISPWFGKKGS